MHHPLHIFLYSALDGHENERATHVAGKITQDLMPDQAIVDFFSN